MSISAMYSAKAGSPSTTLVAEIPNDATTMTLQDASVLPEAPNICVIGEEANAEIVHYTSINGNTVGGLSRGLGGTTAQAWIAGTTVARNFTSFDHDTFKANIEALEAAKAESSNVYSKAEANALLEDKSDVSHTHDGRYYTEDEVNTKLAAKANLASPSLTGTPTAPTAASGTNTTQIATTAFVKAGLDGKAASSHTHDDRYYTESEVDTKLNGKAASSHTHAAGDIASGTLSVERGGTGNANGTVAKLTTARTIRTNLASTSTASFDGSANISPGVTGTLPIGNGGTGNTTGQAATAVKLAQNRRLLTYLANKYDGNSSSSSYNGQWDLSGNTAIPVFGTLGVANGGTGGVDSGWDDFENSSAFSGTIRYRKVGIFAFIQAYGIKLAAALSSGSNVSLGSGVYAASGYVAVLEGSGGAGSGVMFAVHVGKTGALTLYNSGSTNITKTTGLYFSGMYFCG